MTNIVMRRDIMMMAFATPNPDRWVYAAATRAYWASKGCSSTKADSMYYRYGIKSRKFLLDRGFIKVDKKGKIQCLTK